MNNQNLMAFKCTPGRIRTLNLLIRSQTLYPVELRAHAYFSCSVPIIVPTTWELRESWEEIN